MNTFLLTILVSFVVSNIVLLSVIDTDRQLSIETQSFLNVVSFFVSMFCGVLVLFFQIMMGC